MFRTIFTLALIIFFITLLIAEKLWPLRQLTQVWIKRFSTNLTLAIPAVLVAGLIVTPVSWHTVFWTSHNSFGLLHVFAMPLWIQFIIGFLLMDLSFYYWHWLNHRLPLLWRFHNVHHVDPDLDASTAIRFHVIEVGYSVLFRFLQISLLGVSPLTFIAYEFCFQLATFFQHTNLRLPIKLERIINKLLVTPRMHGIHHSQIMTELNTNFSTVFSCWDHLHRTIRLNIPQADIKIGIPGYCLPQDNHFWRLLLLPFTRQRDYWRLPDGRIPSRETSQIEKTYLLE